MKTYVHLWQYLVEFFLEWAMFQTNVVENIKTHFMFSDFFSTSILAVYEIMWKNMVEREWPQMTKWRMRFACWISKATKHTQNMEYLLFSTATMVTRKRLSVTSYLHFVSCYGHCATPCGSFFNSPVEPFPSWRPGNSCLDMELSRPVCCSRTAPTCHLSQYSHYVNQFGQMPLKLLYSYN